MFSNNNDNDNDNDNDNNNNNNDNNNNNNISLIVGGYNCDDNILTCKRCEQCINQLENSTSPYPSPPDI